jgi:SprT protein
MTTGRYQGLSKYLPDGAYEVVEPYLEHYEPRIKITRGRHSKTGDYRPPIISKYHRISINHNLGKYTFLLTLIHELAHLVVWERYGRKVQPHGKEWKAELCHLLDVFIPLNIFPEGITVVLKEKKHKMPASFSADPLLVKALQRSEGVAHQTYVEDLPENALFSFRNGRRFKKLNKMRTRYRCLCLDNKKYYLFSPHAPVEPITGP